MRTKRDALMEGPPKGTGFVVQRQGIPSGVPMVSDALLETYRAPQMGAGSRCVTAMRIYRGIEAVRLS
jgi:hypothetical protein